MIDLLIKGASVIDGSGGPPQRADLAIQGDQIIEVGVLGDPEAVVTLDASGLVVTPGFVDPHSHSDFTLHSNPAASSAVRQGVTTEIVGNCGLSNAPLSDASRPATEKQMRSFGFDGECRWDTFEQYLASVESVGTARNVAFLVGASAIRAAAGAWTHADAAQRQMMCELVEEAMDAGALGLSSGLEYGHGRWTTTEELTELARTVGRDGGIYTSHIRNRDRDLLPAIEEFLAVIRDSGVPGQVSHLNVRASTGAAEGAWAASVEALEAARRSGVDVETDMTPFREGLGMMVGLLPEWLVAPGLGIAAEQLKDPAVRRTLRGDCDRYWRFLHKGEWHRVRLLNSMEMPEYNGLTFPEIAELAHKDEWDCYFDILSAAGASMDSLEMVGELFTEEHLAEMVDHPLFSFGVDGYASAAGLSGPVPDSPLSYAGHIHYLAHHVRERGYLSLQEAVKKMTSMPATRFGLRGRGLLAKGYFADLVVFDPATVASDSSFTQPAVYPRGIELVVVNGTVVVDGKGETGALPGRILRA